MSGWQRYQQARGCWEPGGASAGPPCAYLLTRPRPSCLQLEEIGHGNFGKVALGLDRLTGELVALKLIQRQKVGRPYSS